MKGNWKVAILSALIIRIIGIIGDIILGDHILWYFSLTSISDALFIFGYTVITMQIVRGSDVKLSEIFYGSKRFLKGLGISLLMELYGVLWSLLLIIPGIIAGIRYSMTYFIWVDNPDIGINEAITKSVEITDGHKMDIFKLYVSFIGWILLAIAPSIIINYWSPKYSNGILSLGMVFVVPYMEVSMGILYNKLIKDSEIN